MQILLFLGLFFVVFWIPTYKAVLQVHSLRSNSKHRTAFAVLPIFCLLFIAYALLKRASPDVRSDFNWIVLYLLGGAAWLQLGLSLLSLFGVSARDDVLERANPAAAWAVYGTLVGTTLCYSGANAGRGPGPQVVLLCAVLSSVCFFVLWFCLERMSGLADRITIDRDEGAGIRSGGWMVGVGIILGAAVAGDWHSLRGAIWDFARYGWVSIIFLLVGIMVEISLSLASRKKGIPRIASVTVALTYILAASVYIAWRGVP